MEDGSYSEFPNDPSLANFDYSDRKFAVIALVENLPVLNATDTDWVQYHEALNNNGIQVEFICGCDETLWFRE
jgi:hypothetical protein